MITTHAVETNNMKRAQTGSTIQRQRGFFTGFQPLKAVGTADAINAFVVPRVRSSFAGRLVHCPSDCCESLAFVANSPTSNRCCEQSNRSMQIPGQTPTNIWWSARLCFLYSLGYLFLGGLFGKMIECMCKPSFRAICNVSITGIVIVALSPSSHHFDA